MKLSRNLTIDAIRGFAIILVVLGHVIQHLDPNFFNNPLFNLIYSFHMPLFMFVSGYVAYFSLQKYSFFEILKKRFIGLIIPFLAWSYLILVIVGHLNLESFIPFFKSTINNLDSTFWFLPILFAGLILLAAISKISRKNPYIEIGLIFGLIVILNLLPFKMLSFPLITWHFPFISAGYLLSKYSYLVQKYYKLLIDLLFLGLIIIVFIYFRSDLFFNYIWPHPVVVRIYSYLPPFVLILLTCLTIKNLNFKFVNYFKKALSYLGNYTLDLYVIHGTLLSIFLVPLIQINNYPGYIINTIYLIFVSLLISLFMRQSRILKFLFFGQYEKSSKRV